jgi:PAS domain S-box-containing protein
LVVGKHPHCIWALRGQESRYIHPDDRRTVQDAIDAAIKRNMPFDLEHRVLRLDGSLGWTHSRAVPLLGPHGKISGWIGAARDITQRKTTEAALAALAEEHSQPTHQRRSAFHRR